MLIQMADPVMLGASCSAVLEVGSLKSALGGSAAELQLEELPAEARLAGWAVSATKLSVTPGEVDESLWRAIHHQCCVAHGKTAVVLS